MKKCFTFSIWAFLIVFSVASQVHSGFSLGVSPINWEAVGQPGDTVRNVVTLTSGTRAIQEVSVSVGDWTLNEDGAPVFAHQETMSDSAASWIRFQPKEFSVYPRQRKTVKISIRIPDEMPSGSYRAALFFEPPGADQEGKSAATTVFIRGRLALPIYVTVGEARPEGKILEAKWKTLKGRGHVPTLKVENRGNAHLRMNGFFSASTLSGNRFDGIIPGLPILPGHTRWIPLEFRGKEPTSDSDLDLILNADLGDGERKFNIKVRRGVEIE